MGDSKWRKVGAMWKPKVGAKSKGSGSLTIGDKKQRFVIFVNEDKTGDSALPDYLLMSTDEPETDSYAAKKRGRDEDETPEVRPANNSNDEDSEPPF
jgi:hypothetical protein